MQENIADKIQQEIFRKMSPEKKLQLAADLYFSARDLKKAALKSQHPEWSEKELNKAVTEIFKYART